MTKQNKTTIPFSYENGVFTKEELQNMRDDENITPSDHGWVSQ